MKYKQILTTIAILLSFLPAQGQELLTVRETVFDHNANLDNFAFGADISWLSQQESWGTYYCNRKGQRADLMTILKEDFGLNALRFRVWVNPAGGWSGKKDVIGLCKRAHAKGYKIMISFHYSDTWADSGSQTIPGQWTDHSADALARNVYEHTKDVLSGLQAEGITPKWVSLGNETKYGMLYETGRTKTTEGYKNFVRFINEGARAVKEISPDIITIVHLPNGHDEGTARSMFDNLKKYGANYDCIGLSAYPRWSHLDVTTDANIASTINKYITVFKNLRSRFGKPVMVMETGHYGTEPYDANRFLAEFMKALIADGDLGCFYWEPEAFDNGGYNLGAWSSATHQGTIAMDAYMGIKHTRVDRYVNTRITLPNDTIIFQPTDSIQLKIYAKTSTTVTQVSKVDYYLGKKLVHSIVPTSKSAYFTYATDTLPPGPYRFHAVITDDQSHTQSTDTLCFMVGNPVVFQESSPAFLGCSDASLTPAQAVKRYTGGAYMPASADRTTYLEWRIWFPQADDYDVYLRYHTEENRSVKIYVDDDLASVTCAATPEGKWAYVKKTIHVPQAGWHTIRLQGLTAKGYPDLDFLAIDTREGMEPVRADEPSGIAGPKAEACGPTPEGRTLYDLGGKAMPAQSSHPRGIYIVGGRKVAIRP